ncbi:hypothetical protein [Streptomyces murinus]|uniref:hypothetical protein n=1 Tax=Streptomyces murinus TaxID=33900 RepID=UPI002115A304|nr:hypothetical protein [Streptomyces murinus]
MATLERERDRMTQRIECLLRSRDAISDYVEAVRVNQARGASGVSRDGAVQDAAVQDDAVQGAVSGRR